MYDLNILLNWFKVNSIKINQKKFHFIVLGKNQDQTKI